MKRSRPPQIPAAQPSRRKRTLAREEVELWQAVTRAIQPLRPRSGQNTGEEAGGDATDGSEIAAVIVEQVVRQKTVMRTVAKPPPPLAPIGRREKAQLSRGRRDIEARLDLHGMTQQRAHRALKTFLHRASEDGLTFVLVITGKGRSGASESERGVLRRLVPEWLSLPEFRNLVVGFEEAAIGHGGAGALYVRVRRAR